MCIIFQGVKRVVEELERKKQLILSIVMKDQDKYLESSEAINTFSENYNKVLTYTELNNLVDMLTLYASDVIIARDIVIYYLQNS
jgi:chemotaxis methyl-accepting protein methylase